MKDKTNQCKASIKYCTVSAKKMNFVAALVRKHTAKQAMLKLMFCPRLGAKLVLDLLKSATANAVNNNGLDKDRLIIDEIYVGKAFTLKRFMARGRGRSTQIKKRFCGVTIVLKELSFEDYNSYGKKIKITK